MNYVQKLNRCKLQISRIYRKWDKKGKKSPEILVAEIKRKIEEFGVIVCAKTIRNCIHKRILNLTEKDMIYKKEYKEKNKEKIHCDKVPAEKSIDFRPKEANERSEYGHCEGDLVYCNL